jgi:hypothetical protein
MFCERSSRSEFRLIANCQGAFDSRIFRLRSRVVIHFGSPFQKATQLFSFSQHESPELHKSDLVHLQAGISFHAPAQVWAAPRGKAMSAG